MPVGTPIPERSIQLKHLAFNLKTAVSGGSGQAFTASPAKYKAIAAEDITAGEPIWLDDSGNAYLADSDYSVNERPCMAIAFSEADTGSELEYIYDGEITIEGATHTANRSVFLDGSALSTTPPTMASDTYLQEIGRAITSERILINIGRAYKSAL